MATTHDKNATRRGFLRQAASGFAASAGALGALGALGAAGCGKAEPARRDQPPPGAGPGGRKLGWAIVGLGKFATEQLLPAFTACSRSRVAALVSGSPDKARALAARYGVAPKSVYDYAGFDRLRDDPAVDVVYVVLPNSMHAEYTIRAARAGKHVMTEKPMATKVEDASAMIEACRAAGRRLMVAYRAQFEPHNRAAVAAVRAGELGAVKLIVADHGRRLDPNDPADTWRTKRDLAGGGSLVDIGIYSLQAARYITGEEPTEVSATLSSPPNDPRFAEVEESVAFTLRFPGGAVATCTSSYGIATVKRYRVMGEKGYLDLDPATSYEGNKLRFGRG
ncbi:MAG TPA: Gfo/Idh/MocA family oxidoreductase, partial [Polyangiaceae bacterium]|nr:Gfo/Idh/MocA family oxidoreductase [Polyangiaceae bacterium]